MNDGRSTGILTASEETTIASVSASHGSSVFVDGRVGTELIVTE